MKSLPAIAVAVAAGLCAWFLQGGSGERASGKADIVTAGLGGFRSVISEVVWFRADRLQDEGRYTEMVQLASMLTRLEPHTPEVWAYAAWNLAYNISAMMPTADDRWRWVEAGLKLLRDDGLGLNPESPELHKELSWLFLAKIGGAIDSASSVYADKWKACVEKAAGDWASLKMDRDVMDAIDEECGKQDWSDPKASALYWASKGLLAGPSGIVRVELHQAQYQTLMLEAVEDPRFAPAALKAMMVAYAETPNAALADMIARFRAKFSL